MLVGGGGGMNVHNRQWVMEATGITTQNMILNGYKVYPLRRTELPMDETRTSTKRKENKNQ